jgi:hypothetical protein
MDKKTEMSFVAIIKGILIKIEKLQRLANKTTFEGEKENALQKIEGIKSSIKNNTIEEIKAKYESLDFPATNYYMIFIYDTEQNCIVYKAVGLTDWAIDELYYNNSKLQWNEKNRLYDNFDYSSRKYHWNDEHYTEEEKEKIKASQKEIIEKVNGFIDILENLDSIDEAYYQKLSKTDFSFEYIETDSKEITEKTFIKSYKDYMRFWKKEKDRYLFKNIKSDNSFVVSKKYCSVYETERERTQVYSQILVPKKIWEKQKRGVLLENKTTKNITKQNYEIIINNEQNGFEVKFEIKPSQNVIDALKNNGFRWSGFNKVWYIKQNKITVEKIEKILKVS